METLTSNRKRFYKPLHNIGQTGNRPAYILWEIFCACHLDELTQELQYWQRLALCNDESAYSESGAREDLMDFMQQLLRLIEAFHILNDRLNAGRKRKLENGLSKEARVMGTKTNIPNLLTAEETENPLQVIKQFCKMFSRFYAQMELLDMLDAVINYKGEKEIHKGNLVWFYEATGVLINLAYKMYRHKKKPT
ncbi:hypothetical protein [Niabella terrae]